MIRFEILVVLVFVEKREEFDERLDAAARLCNERLGTAHNARLERAASSPAAQFNGLRTSASRRSCMFVGAAFVFAVVLVKFRGGIVVELQERFVKEKGSSHGKTKQE